MMFKAVFKTIQTNKEKLSKESLIDRYLNLYHAIPNPEDSEGKTSPKTLWEEEKMMVTSSFFSSQNVSYAIKGRNRDLNNILLFCRLQMLKIDFDQAKILSFGIEFIDHFDLNLTSIGVALSAIKRLIS